MWESKPVACAAWLPFATVFAVAVGVRLVVAFQLENIPLFRTPWLDSAEYLDWGRRLAQAATAWPASPPHGPGYPLFLAAIFTFVGDSLSTVRYVQAILGGISCVLVSVLSTRWFGRRAGIAAGLCQAAYGPLVLADVSIMAEGLLVFLLLLATWAAAATRGVVWQVVAGLAVGCATITRPTALLVAPAVLFVAAEPGGGRSRVLSAGAFLAACALVLVPVVAKNWRVSGAPMVQAFGGMNFYLGNAPSGDGLPSARPGAGWQALNSEASSHGIDAPADQDRYYFAKALREIGQAPVAYARLLLSKALWTVQAEEVRDTHSYYFFAAHSPLLAWLPGFGFLLPFALVGFVAAIWRRVLPGALAWYLVATAATCLFLVVASRYRLPMVLGLIALAGHGFDLLVDEVTRRAVTRPAVVYTVTLAVGFLAAHVSTHKPSHNFAEEWVYTGKSLEAEGALVDAESAYRKAVGADDRSEYAWDRLGALLLQSGRRDEGRRALARAVELAPRYADGVYHLGLSDEAVRQFDSAASNFRKAVQLAPDLPQYRQALARVLVSAGHYDEAERLYSDLVERWPNDASSHVGLAFLLIARGDAKRGFTEAQAATVLAPRNEQGWLLLTRAALDTRNLAIAQSALHQAELLLQPRAPEIEYLRGELRKLLSPIEGRH